MASLIVDSHRKFKLQIATLHGYQSEQEKGRNLRQCWVTA
jgi:hypothetical protein